MQNEGRHYSYLYGPVPSRRLGLSLGVDIVPYKVCSYDCVYCTLGRTTRLTSAPEQLVRAADVVREIEEWLRQGGTADYITFAGSGEPTLNSELGEMVKATKKLTDTPVAVITNGSLLSDRGVYEAVASADLIVPSLDAGTEEAFRQINRPADDLDLMDVISGLQWMAQGFDGAIWLEVMLVKGINDTDAEMRAIQRIINNIYPDRVQINTVERPSRSGDVEAVDADTLERALSLFGSRSEIILGRTTDPRCIAGNKRSEQAILDMLRRRPCTLEDIASAFGMHTHEVLKHIGHLTARNMIEATGDTRLYYRPARSVNGGNYEQ